MLDIALTPIHPIIMALPYVERYGSLARKRERHIEVGQTADGQVTTRIESFPVTCTMSDNDCWLNGKYANLIPNTALYKSLFFFEEESAMQYNRSRLTNDYSIDTHIKLTGTARLTFWLNIPQLFGEVNCEMRGFIQAELISKLLDNAYSVNNNGFVGVTRIDGITALKHGDSAYNKYTVPGLEKLGVYPYEQGDILINITFFLNRLCLTDIAIGTPVDCLTEW